jgi:hypothetical protein
MSMTKWQRWALPTDFLYSDSYWTKKKLSKYLTNTGLQISEQKQSTSDRPIAIRLTEIYRIKMGNFYSFLCVSSRLFREFPRKLISCWRPYCAIGVPAVASTEA